ncbi:hypothetical protein, partial [Campylobacter jejuni]|uniref:hypothetical protein n=1 Tax=Campylobacter jejuni TaxID=197 RepID=UPI00100262DE
KVESEGLAFDVEKAAGAAEKKAGTAIEERNNKIDYAGIQKDIKDGKADINKVIDFANQNRNM